MNRNMMKSFSIAAALMGMIAFGGVEGSWAQGLNPFAPAPASDALNSASPTGGLNATTYTGRATAAAAAYGGGKDGMGFAPPPGGMPPQYAGYPPGGVYGAVPGQLGFAAPTPTQGPPPATVVTGERVYSHLQFGAFPPELLQDAERIQVPGVIKELSKQYFDDGSHGDIKAGDSVWSYITRRNDVMSPEEFRILNRIISALTAGEDTDPREFFRLPVATTEPLSELPQMMDLEGRRDDKITEWDKRVLAEFRVTKDDVTSQFWPVFVPPPPSAPRMEIPPGYDPSAKPESEAGPTGGAMMGMEPGMEGMPSGASSSYGMQGFGVK